MKRKRLTAKEKKFNAELRKEMREKGILPPIKPKLNRRKFVKETRTEYAEEFNRFDDIIYLYEAINWMLPSGEYKTQISPEEVGVAKVLKMAIEIKKFNKEKLAKGNKTYKLDDLYKTVIEPIRSM